MKHQIPTHRIGAESMAISELELPSVGEARTHYQTVKARFLNINSWELFAGKEKAEFSLRDEYGKLSLEKPKVGNYISIKIPLLHNPDDEGMDWVKIEVCEENISDEEESNYIRVRPASKPGNSTDEITHFLNNDATSNFIIKRNGCKVTAEVIARNEVPNTKDKTVLEKLRNKIVAFGGMLLGSKIQWEGLTNGLIEYEK
ncbi:hypothetical protein FNJ88_00095 [Chryseobacterium sp. SNU WT5]|uniref:hypothetical protein n=1 Tax=Chryseobacterium sp. SNU WT5 TaxID=2594269 RepID=UPI00117D0C08|nr:hypothetical protein [Chryseobacterium sp. SNU WT5]QDP84025.1 hypothetical protein FNJ88_00095 [Chryseobacterium sp. SNU WT5]